MFEYIEKRSFLHSLNPIVKLGTVLAITVIVSLSFYPLLPLITFILSVVVISVGGMFTIIEILKRVRIFLGIAISFIFFMLILRGIDNPGAIYQIWIFSWNPQDFVYVFSLGLRIITIVTMSMGFVLTTSPNKLVLSLILQLKIPYLHGYATLAAYRFLPTLQNEIKSIRLAQEIRGIEWERGIINRLRAPFRIMLPLLSNAVRRGEKVSIAMESRGLGYKNKRTFYKRTGITRNDIIFIGCALLLYAGLVGGLIATGNFHYSFGFKSH